MARGRQYKNKPKTGFSRLMHQLSTTNSYGKAVFLINALYLLTMIVAALLNVIWNLSYGTVLNPLSEQASYSSFGSSLIIIVSTLGTCLIGTESVLRENEVQLVLFFITSLAQALILTVFMSFRIFEVLDAMLSGNSLVTPVTVIFQLLTICVPMLIILLCQTLLILVAVPLYRSFGWRVFRKIGSNLEIRRYYRAYLIYVALLKVDAILSAIAIVWHVFFFKYNWIPSYAGLVLMLSFTLIVSPLSVQFGVKREMYIIQVMAILWGIVTPFYLVYHAVHSFVEFEECNMNSSMLGNAFSIDTLYVAGVFAFLAAAQMLTRLAVLIMCVVTTIHFQRGLKDIFEGRTTSSIFQKHEEMSRIQALFDQGDSDDDDDNDNLTAEYTEFLS